MGCGVGLVSIYVDVGINISQSRLKNSFWIVGPS